MMSLKASICLEKKLHEVTLTSLNLKCLQEKVNELLNTTSNGNSIHHFKITDNSGQDINNDQQLKTAFEIQPVFFYIHIFQSNEDEKKHTEDKKKEYNNSSDDECHKIVNPLVLLTGAAKYKTLDYLPG
ncbi:hypothetical protein RFI_35330, partial [Reticulomyxa filosa]